MAIEDKLAATRFVVDAVPHIKVDVTKCESCLDKPCLYVCPVQNYVLKEGNMEFAWQGCMECGACRISCVREAIKWNYPRGGFGVCLRYG